MVEIVLNGVFTVTAVMFVGFAIWFLARRYFPVPGNERNVFVLLCLITLGIRILFVALMAAFMPDRIVTPDGARYFFEIRQIAWAPWEWNPLTGVGPYYDTTAKMGMSYIYGLVLFLFQIESLYGILVLNIICAFLGGVVVFLLTRMLCDSLVPAFLAMFLTGVYPETLFWVGRISRENVTVLLVPALLYTSIRLHETHRLRYLVYIVVVLALLLLVRAQLALFGVLIAIYFTVMSLRGQRGFKAVLISLGLVALLYSSFTVIRTQIERAVGAGIFQYLTFDYTFWLSQIPSFLQNIGSVLTPVARGSYGLLGLVILPFLLAVGLLFVLALIGYRRVFHGHTSAAGLVLFVTASFLGMLAVVGLVNIRFRATVAPLIISVVSVSAHYYWRELGLPRIRLLSSRSGYSRA